MAATTHRALRIIAAYKIAKAVGLVIVAIAAFDLVQSRQVEALADWIMQFQVLQGHPHVVALIDKLLGLGPRKFTAIGGVACVYAALFVIEGWGLWREKRWAEYLTSIVTASLIPLEAWEIHHHFTWLKVLALAVNVVIVGYLVYLLRQPKN